MEYVKSSTEIIMQMKTEEKESRVEEIVQERVKEMAGKGEVDMSQSSVEYEKIIQKLEAEVRNHISVQQQMKLYIESYQSKIEELEVVEEKSDKLSSQILKMEESNKRLLADIEEIKSMHKEKKAEWKLKEQEYRNEINKNQTKHHFLENKVKDLETILKTQRTFSGSSEKEKNPSKIFTNKIESRGNKGELILLKDESLKMGNESKIKYMLKNIPGGSAKAGDDSEDAFISFSELSTKTPDKSKIYSSKKQNPYKIEYVNHNPDIFENLKNEIKINRKGRINVNPNYSRAKYNNESIDENHKRSKSQTMNSLKSKKVSKSTELSMLGADAQKHANNVQNSYNMINEYLENPKKMISVVQNPAKQPSSGKNKSRGPNSMLRKKNLVGITGPNAKKMSFKSFDQRRAFTRIDQRDSSLEDPTTDSYIALYANPLRSSSA